jgi:hypothetical protein
MFVLPSRARHRRPDGTKAFYLPAPPPVFVLPGHQRLAQHPAAVPHRPQQSSIRCQPDIFDIVGELRNDGASSPLRQNSSQKRQNQWRRWSQDVVPALMKPYLRYLEASQSLRVVVDAEVGDQSQCPTCTMHQLTIYCLFFDRM